MVTRKMKTYGKVVAELDYDVYKAILGSIRIFLPKHVYVSPERVTVEGRKKVRLWCLYPEVGKEAVEQALREQGA